MEPNGFRGSRSFTDCQAVHGSSHIGVSFAIREADTTAMLRPLPPTVQESSLDAASCIASAFCDLYKANSVENNVIYVFSSSIPPPRDLLNNIEFINKCFQKCLGINRIIRKRLRRSILYSIFWKRQRVFELILKFCVVELVVGFLDQNIQVALHLEAEYSLQLKNVEQLNKKYAIFIRLNSLQCSSYWT